MPRNAKNPAQPNLFADVRSETAEVLSDPLAHLRRPLTKADLDKVRDVEGFPIGADENIIALSDPPYYTACPNPFVADFVRAYGKLYDEATDTYHREPFDVDVSEGKNDPIYLAQSYHTKVPHKAIMRYILHYTVPGDLVFDGFCGTGMTGVAAQICARPDPLFRAKVEAATLRANWGARKAILCDLGPSATFIAYNYNTPNDPSLFERDARRALSAVQAEMGWMFLTLHEPKRAEIEQAVSLLATSIPTLEAPGSGLTWGRVNYVIWSDVFVCPECSGEVVFWDAAVDKTSWKVHDDFLCPHCRAEISKRQLERQFETHVDRELGQDVRQVKQLPVLIHNTVGKKRGLLKKPDEFDFALLSKIEAYSAPYPIPTTRLPKGDKTAEPIKSGITHVHHFYTRRNLLSLASYAAKMGDPRKLTNVISVAAVITKMYRFRSQNQSLGAGGGPMAGTLYVPSLTKEIPITKALSEHIAKTTRLKRLLRGNGPNLISTNSHADLRAIPDSSVDYVFTDPPFGSNIMYSELSFLWEAWLKVFTNTDSEAVISKTQGKALPDYQEIMSRCFAEAYRVLKPGRWITTEFHNSQNRVWNAIQEAIQRAGFIVADVRTLDKEQGAYNQYNAAGAVKQDLIISAYKPRASFEIRFIQEAGTEQGAWDFVRQHLRQLPVCVEKDNAIEIVAERQNYLLFDRMVAYYVQRGVSVPLSAAEFYAGLRNRFSERDSMFFLPEQVGEYDTKRALASQVEQLALFVNDKKSAVQWLRVALETERQTYQDLMPKFLQEVHQARHELLPELSQLLTENFLKDEKDFWYVPDSGRAEDLEKLRERGLLREFEGYQATKGKLKTFRTEAVRAGFKVAWARREYTTIVSVAQRLPEDVLQEDAALLMYYDNALMRQGA